MDGAWHLVVSPVRGRGCLSANKCIEKEMDKTGEKGRSPDPRARARFTAAPRGNQPGMSETQWSWRNFA